MLMKTSGDNYTEVYIMGETPLLGVMNSKQPTLKVPKLCSYSILIREIACGAEHTHILTKEGFVYSMGMNQYGVLGLGLTE